jgi:hypothetical protein
VAVALESAGAVVVGAGAVVVAVVVESLVAFVEEFPELQLFNTNIPHTK